MSQNNEIVNLGFDNYIPINQIVAVLNVDARYIKPLISRAEIENKLINLTRKRKTRSLVITKEGYMLLSIFNPRTLSARIEKNRHDMLAIGEQNYISKQEVLIILNKKSSQIEELVKKARAQVKVFNTQSGNVTESYIYTKSGYVFLSFIKSKTLSERYSRENDSDEMEIN